MVSHPLSMREALGSIPSVSMHHEAAALSHGWFGCRGAELAAVGTVRLLGRCLGDHEVHCEDSSSRQIAGTHDFTLRGQAPGQLACTYIWMAPWGAAGSPCATAVLRGWLRLSCAGWSTQDKLPAASAASTCHPASKPELLCVECHWADKFSFNSACIGHVV